MKRLFSLVLVMFSLLASIPAIAQVSARLVVVSDAPIFALPDTTRTPLRVAKAGTELRQISKRGENWYLVDFNDPQWGPREGYIQTRFVQVAAADYSRIPAQDLSVRDPEPQASGRPDVGIAPAPNRQVPRTAPVVGDLLEKSRSTKGFIGVGLEGNGIVTDTNGASDTESGVGGGLVVGYGFNPRWSLYGDISTANMNEDAYSLAHVDIGARMHFLADSHRVVPFVQFGLSGRGESWKDARLRTVTASGAGVAFGGGINTHFTPAFALSTGVTWSVGNFTNYKIDGQDVPGDSVGATSARIHIGVIWFPNRSAKSGA